MCLAIPGKIESIEGKEPLDLKGKVNFGGVVKEISLASVPEAKVGQYVVVHVGVAISIVHEQEALKAYEHLKEIGEIEKELEGQS